MGKYFRAKKTTKSEKPVTTRTVKRLIGNGQEGKFKDTSGSLAVDTATAPIDLTDITVGTSDVGTRVGDKLKYRNIDLRYSIAVGDTTNMVRVVIVQWKQVSTPTLAQIFQSSGAAISPHSPFYHDNAPQIRVVYDRLHAISAYGPGLISLKKLIYKIPIKNLQFNSGGTSGSNKLYLCLMSDSATASHPQMDYYARVNYTDS